VRKKIEMMVLTLFAVFAHLLVGVLATDDTIKVGILHSLSGSMVPFHGRNINTLKGSERSRT
jgi:hypothetical protein